MCSFSNLLHICFLASAVFVYGQNEEIIDELSSNSGVGQFVQPVQGLLARSVACGSDTSQTICLPPIGSECGSDSINGVGFSDAEKTEMLNLHNEKRAVVARGEALGMRACTM